MRGHLGTEAANKASDVIRVTKKKTSSGVKVEVEQIAARGRDIDPWEFVVTEDAGKLGVPKITNSGVVLPSAVKIGGVGLNDWKRLCDACDVVLGNAISLSKNKLEYQLKYACKFGTNKVRDFIDKAIEFGMIIERPGNTWGYDKDRAREVIEKLDNKNNDPTLPF